MKMGQRREPSCCSVSLWAEGDERDRGGQCHDNRVHKAQQLQRER